MSNKNNSQKYTEDLKDWQRNQYNPGTYTGGNFPPDLKYGGKKFGYVVLVQGLALLLIGVTVLTQTEEFVPGIVITIMGLIICFAGWNKTRRSKQK